ncbi:hypothetical protein OG794_29665 [Streptomyces albidoflavus]|nr:hypothetical protein [Streptomyces sp. M10]WTC05724.1 hypothetical protein OG794_29665 [Streptomyces albidoflavus]
MNSTARAMSWVVLARHRKDLGQPLAGQRQSPPSSGKSLKRAAARLGQAEVPSSSLLMVEKNDSASALSRHWPVRPIDSRTPN